MNVRFAFHSGDGIENAVVSACIASLLEKFVNTGFHSDHTRRGGLGRRNMTI